MELQSSWQFWALLSAFFAAMTAILAKLGVQNTDPDVATLVRTIVIVGLLSAILATSGKLGLLQSIPGSAIGWLVASGAATGASWFCYFRALKLGPASQVAPIDKLSVVFVAILAAVLLGEQISLTGWAGVAMIAAGAVLLAIG